MRRKVLTVYGLVLLIFTLGFWLGVQSVTAPVQAQASTYLSASLIPNAGTLNQVWMRDKEFCIRGWWYDEHGQLVRLCSEYKTDTPSPGANFKVDLPGPAALTLIGKGDDERWELSAVALAKPDSQLPGDNFVRVTGPTLVTILSQVTPPPVSSPFPAPVTLLPTGATATPTARVTPTPPSPLMPTPTQANPGRIPTLSYAQKNAFTVRCDWGSNTFTMTIWGDYGLVYSVPGEWCSEASRGAESLLERMAQVTPSRIEVRP